MAQFDLLQRAKARMLFNHVFFSTLLLGTPTRYMTEDETKMMRAYNNGSATAFTDMKEIVVNREFIEGPEMGTVERVMFVLAHELGHIILKHGLRRQGRNPKKWNIAADHASNLMLKADGFEVWSKAACDPAYVGMSSEAIYEKLPDNPKGGSGGLGQDIKEPTDPINGDPAEEQRISADITQRVAQAAVIARQAGKMSADLERIVGEILHPPLPWRDILREYMTRIANSQETWARRNRRFPKVYLPTRHNKVMGPMIVLGDTSGSITDDDIAQISGELSFIREIIKPSYVKVFWGDTKVKHEQHFEPADDLVLKPVGGGGTDMRKLLEHVEDQNPEVVVLITDGFTPWPDREPPFPTIVVCTTPAEVPIGTVVRYAA